MGFGPTRNQHTCVGRLVATGRPEAREGPDVQCLSGVRRFGSDVLQSDVRSGSDVRRSSEIRRFGSGVVAPVVRRGPVVRGLEFVGRPGFAGHLVPGSFEQSFFLSIELGVLQVPGHT